MRHDDGDQIVSMLTGRLEPLLDTYAPGWVAHKGKAYLSAKGPKDLGSFQVNLTGSHRGQWYRFSQQVGGGPISLLAYLLAGQTGEPTREDNRRAFEEARKFLGLSSGEVDREAAERARQRREDALRQQEVEAEQDRLGREASAAEIWERSKPITGTLAESYLLNRVRGLTPDQIPQGPLRFSPRCWHGEEGRAFPAMICRVDDEAGNLCGVWRIYLDQDGNKAPIAYPKLGLGSSTDAGAACRLWAPDNGTVAVCEGVETAFGIHLMTGLPVWSCLQAPGLKAFRPPFEIERVFIFPDGDPWKLQKTGTWLEPTGDAAAEALASRLRSEGLVALVQPSPEPPLDFLDVWNEVQERAVA